MQITGTQTIPASRQRVWDALNDPAVLKKCLPGCESVERTSPEEFKVVMAAAIGPLRARFNGMLRMSDVNAPESCTMVFEGQGGAVGFGKGNSSVTLTESEGQTQLSYTADAQVGGKLAQVGSRLIDSVARKMADDFFKAFKAQLAALGGADAATAEPAASAAPAAGAARAAVAPAAMQPGKEAAQAATPSATASTASPGSASPIPAAPAAATATHAAPATSASQPHIAQPTAPSTVMVPGWWLAVAAVIGSASTVAGLLFAR